MASKGGIIRGAVFASGNGTNAENILRFALKNSDKISIPVVICNRKDAFVIQRASALGVPCEVIPVEREGYTSFLEARLAQEQKVLSVLKKYGVEWVFLAGYMQVISSGFLALFADPVLGVNRVVNIHPSLLPAFPGKDGYGDAWKAGVKTAGVTLHFVDEGVDTGPVIAQRQFDRLPQDSFDDFRARGMQLEYEVYNDFLQKLVRDVAAEGKYKWA